jgi:hypothetical protein
VRRIRTAITGTAVVLFLAALPFASLKAAFDLLAPTYFPHGFRAGPVLHFPGAWDGLRLLGAAVMLLGAVCSLRMWARTTPTEVLDMLRGVPRCSAWKTYCRKQDSPTDC